MSGANKRKDQRAKAKGELPVLNPNAAGVDIGATEIYVAVPPEELRARHFWALSRHVCRYSGSASFCR